MSDVAIRVEGLGKRYRLGGKVTYRRLSEAVASAVKRPFQRLRRDAGPPIESHFWALRDVSFEVPRGQVVGIVGRNGAGKSTLLKILARITEPTTGQATFRGRLGSLLEVGTGFHPELTGRENIFLNGAMLGMSRREILGKFDAIVAFAEIDRFLDTPVKRYSSGMYARLGFAVAAHLQCDIVLVDEVLAVGDTAFQSKCLEKLRDLTKTTGRTFLFVSHNLAAIASVCKRAVLLERGTVLAHGPTGDILQAYSSLSFGVAGCSSQESASLVRSVRVTAIRPASNAASGLCIEVQMVVALPSSALGIDLTLRHGDNPVCFASSAYCGGLALGHGLHQITCIIGPIFLAAGTYDIDLRVCEPHVKWHHETRSAARLQVPFQTPTADLRFVLAAERSLGFVIPPQDWSAHRITLTNEPLGTPTETSRAA